MTNVMLFWYWKFSYYTSQHITLNHDMNVTRNSSFVFNIKKNIWSVKLSINKKIFYLKQNTKLNFHSKQTNLWMFEEKRTWKLWPFMIIMILKKKFLFFEFFSERIQIQFFLTKIYSFQMKWFNLHMNMKLIFKNQNKHNGKQNNHHLFGIKSVEIWNLFIFDSIFRWKTKLKTTTIPMFIWIKFKSF